MRYVISGLLLLLGMMLFFMFITACAPARTMTRDTAAAEKGASVQSGESENYDFSFDEEEPASAKSVSVASGKKAGASAAPKLSSSAAKKSDGEIEDDEYEDSASEHSERFYQKGEASWYEELSMGSAPLPVNALT